MVWAPATAQDVTVVHMKDGSTHRYINGVKGTTNVRFWKYAETTAQPTTTTTGYGDFSLEWDVNGVWNNGTDYAVGIYWESDMPANFKPRHGLLWGSNADLREDNCEMKKYTEETYRYRDLHEDFPLGHFMTIGAFIPKNGQTINIVAHDKEGNIKQTKLSMFYEYDSANCVLTPLQPGNTYYYRTFVEGDVLEQGQVKTVSYYGPVRSFTVPHIMADEEYYSYVHGTLEAMATFGQHFPEGVTRPTWEQLERLWNEWRSTTEGAAIDLTPHITTKDFDDGKGYRLNYIPDEFYTWLTQRNFEIDVFDGLKKVDDRDASAAIMERVENVDAQWGLPGDKYMRFLPIESGVNVRVAYHSDEMVPGVNYRVEVCFAPETLYEDTPANQSIFLPTIARITQSADSKTCIDGTVSAKEVSTLTADSLSTTSMGGDIYLWTHVFNSMIRNGEYNRILRVAQIRFTPM